MTLKELLSKSGGLIDSPVYRVKVEGKTAFVAAKSKAQAALATCDVELVSKKELLEAAYQVIAESAKAK